MRFKIGEMAIYAVAINPELMKYKNQQCTVVAIGPYSAGQVVPHPTKPGQTAKVVHGGDYIVTFADGQGVSPHDWQLRKINPPEEPESLKHHEEATA